MLILEIDTFCRVGEIVSLKKTDIDFDRGIIRLRSTMTKSLAGQAYVDSSSRHVLISKEGKHLQDGKQIKGKIVDVVSDNIFYLDSDKALYRTQLASDKTEKIMDLKSDTIVEINVPPQYVLYAKTNNELYKVQWK
jgi:integrase